MKMSKGSYNFLFVYHNWTAGELERVLALPAPVKHVCVGEEQCPSTGTPHLQCCLHFKDAKQWTAARTFLQQHVGRAPNDIETCTSTYETNVAYCKKGAQPKDEWNEKPNGGTRGPNYGRDAVVHERGQYYTKKAQGETQQERAKRNLEAASEGRWDDVDADIIAHRLQSFQAGVRFFSELRNGTPERLPGRARDYFEWHWGVSDSGKSEYCRHQGPTYFHPMGDSWDGYRAGDVVVFADVDESYAHWLRNIKTWFDVDPFRVKVLHDRPLIRPARMIVTSNVSPQDLFARWGPEHVNAVLRRFKVFYWSQPYFQQDGTVNPDWEPPAGLDLPEAMVGMPIDEPGPEWTECAI